MVPDVLQVLAGGWQPARYFVHIVHAPSTVYTNTFWDTELLEVLSPLQWKE